MKRRLLDLVATLRKHEKHDEQPSELCSRCSDIDLQSECGFCHHDFGQLRANATNHHCPLCELFFEPFRNLYIPGDSSSNITIFPRTRKLGYKFYGHKEMLFEIVGGTESNVSGISGNQQNTGQITTGFRLTSPIPLDDQNMVVVNHWLRSCSMEHDCGKQTPGSFSPTRLLDIRGPQVRLVSLQEKNLRYTILSHCWGHNTRFVTTESTIELFRHKIDWSALPATFRDAITTSRKLNVNYLWIDSLCIIQDSRIDWEKECQNMGGYYKNAYLTLSALDSPDSDTGFLHPRQSLPVKLSKSHWIRQSSRVSNSIFRESFLNKRGWALQERLLSTRILHFSRDELLWECLTCSATESSSKEHYETVDISSLVSSEGQDFKRAALHLGPDPYSLSDGTFAAWYRIVKQFSRRSLTYESDRLPAISGVARFIGQRTGFTYLAGLWEQDPHGLIWCIDGPRDRVSHRSTTREHVQSVDVECPSWSWAKMKHSVSWRFYEQSRTGMRGDANILQSKIVSNIGDPYGVVQTAELELEATTLDVQCMPAHWDAPKNIRGYYTSLPQDVRQSQEHINAYREGLNLDIYHGGVMIGTGCYDDPKMAETMVDCSAIHVAERKYDSSSIEINYFLLVQLSSLENGAWERIGMGMTRDTAFEKYLEQPEYFEKVFEGRPKEIIRLV